MTSHSRRARKPLANILSGDILIADVNIDLKYKTKEEIAAIRATNPELATKYVDIDTLEPDVKEIYLKLQTYLDGVLDRKKSTRNGGKFVLDKAEFEEMANAISGLNTIIVPGGSSANTLVTLGKLLGSNVRTHFFGVVGEGIYSSMIKRDLDDADIKLFPSLPENAHPESAVSFVFTDPNGERCIGTYRGNAKSILTPHLITHPPTAIRDAGIFFIQGSLWQKFGSDIPNKLLEYRWNRDKEIWFALPTQTQFDEAMPKETYQWLLASADVILGNEDEVIRLFPHPHKTPLSELPVDEKTHEIIMSSAEKEERLRYALIALQETLQKRDATKINEQKSSKHPPKAFITSGKHGAYFVTVGNQHTPGQIGFVSSYNFDPQATKYTLGAGDAAYTGFLAGHIAGISVEDSAKFGMVTAGLKVLHRGRLKNPVAELEGLRQKEASPVSSANIVREEAIDLWEKIKNGIQKRQQEERATAVIK